MGVDDRAGAEAAHESREVVQTRMEWHLEGGLVLVGIERPVDRAKAAGRSILDRPVTREAFAITVELPEDAAEAREFGLRPQARQDALLALAVDLEERVSSLQAAREWIRADSSDTARYLQAVAHGLRLGALAARGRAQR